MFESAGYKGGWKHQKYILSSLLITATEKYLKKNLKEKPIQIFKN